MSPVLALNDGSRFVGRRSLSERSGQVQTSALAVSVENDPGCVKTPRGITVPGILGPVVMRRAKKHKNLSSARHDDQIGFRFRTAKTQSGRQAQGHAFLLKDKENASRIVFRGQ